MGRHPKKIEGNGSPITYMWEVHREIARLQVAGMRPVQISEKLGYSQSWLSTIMCSPIYQKYLKQLSERAEDKAVDIKKRIEEGAETGVMELLKVLKGEGEYKGTTSAALKVKVAQDFLDRNGNAKITKVESNNTVTVLNEDRIAALKANREKMLQNLAIDPATEGSLPEQSLQLTSNNSQQPKVVLEAEVVL